MTEYNTPDINLLRQSPAPKKTTPEEYEQSLAVLQNILESYGIRGTVTSMTRSPLVTNYDFQPDNGVRIEDIRAVSEDIARALATDNRVIITPVPYDTAVNIAIPNDEPDMVHLGDFIHDDKFPRCGAVSWLLGMESTHQTPVVSNLSDMEHVLVSGCPETGKSALLRSLVLSVLYTCIPDQCQLVLIDTKGDTFAQCDGMPHLAMPVAKSMSDGAFSLQFVQNEIKKRLDMSSKGGWSDRAHLVVVIDEVSDLMKISHDTLEYIARFGARVGVHLVMATRCIDNDQTTASVAVYIPTRMTFRTCTRIDSLQSLRAPGAENLLDCGDMLMSDKQNGLTRIHTVCTYHTELTRVVHFLTAEHKTAEDKDLFRRAKECVLSDEKPTLSYLQRCLQIGYNKACELMEWLEADGVVSEPDENGKRYVCNPEERIDVKPAGTETK